MDGLSTASSIFAVVSIGIQLAESVRTLIEFWSAVEDAPDNISAMFHDLELLCLVLEEGQSILKIQQYHKATNWALNNCLNKVFKLQRRLQKPLLDFKSQKGIRRTWSAFKVTLGQKEILSLQEAIEKAKSTLLLAQLTSLQYSIAYQVRHNRTKNYRHLLRSEHMLAPRKLDEPTQDTIICAEGQIGKMRISRRSNKTVEAQDIVRLQHGNAESMYINNQTLVESSCLHTSRSWDFTKPNAIESADADMGPEVYVLPNHLASFVATKKSRGISQITGFNFLVEQQPSKEKPGQIYKNQIYAFYPPRILSMLGVSRGIQIISSNILGSVYTLQPFRAVAADALIFIFCREGNLAGVKTLFSLGQASPWDRDPEGRTPLWAAAHWLRVDIVELLLNEGADRYAFDWRYGWKPVVAAANSSYLDVKKQIPIFRMLLGHSDSQDHVHSLGYIIKNYRPGRIMKMPQADRNESLRQVVNALVPGVFSNKHHIAGLLCEGLLLQYNSLFLRSVLDKIVWFPEFGTDRASGLYDERSPLNVAIERKMLTKDPELVKMIIRKTRDLHISNPTSLVMLQPGLFFAWRDILLEMGFDMQEFIKNDVVEEKPLISAGWNEESLMQLFTATPHAMGIPHKYLKDETDCDRCGSGWGTVGSKLDLAWRVQLRALRQGSPNKSVQPYEDILSALPHRTVCLDSCRDRLCVAWLFENSLVEEAIFPPYLGPWKPQAQSTIQEPRISEVVEKTDECPSQNMPGAFKD